MSFDEKIKRTDTMIENIRRKQKELGYTDDMVAASIPDMTTDKYKNIIRARKEGGNVYVKESDIYKLADLFDCTKEELIGSTDGKNRIKAVDFSEINQIRKEFFNSLKNDNEALIALHFLLCRGDDNNQEKNRKRIIELADQEKMFQLLEFFHNKISTEYEFVMENSLDNMYGEEYREYIVKWHKANRLYEKEEYELALPEYYRIICVGMQNHTFKDIADKSIEKVMHISNEWDEFPVALDWTIEYLKDWKVNYMFKNDAKEKAKELEKYLEES